MIPTTGDLVTCAICKQEFECEWTAEEALAEMETNFKNVDVEKVKVICTDCYEKHVKPRFN